MNGRQLTVTDRLGSRHFSNTTTECFVGHSQEAPWSEGLKKACKEVLPDFGLTPWFATEHFDPNQPLLEKVIQAIAQTRCGIYDLSYWKRNEHNDDSEWIMPRNVLIELGIAVALNRPTLLLRQRKNRDKIRLAKCLESVSSDILEFSGSNELKGILKDHLPGWMSTSPDQDSWNLYCSFGRATCEYRKVYPHIRQMGQSTLHGHIADGQDTDSKGFREVVKEVLGRFKDVDFCFLDDERVLKEGYKFLFCTYCQLVRSSPFAIYYITPKTSAETFIAIGMSLALETQFTYKIPKIFFATNMQHVPSLLSGHQIIIAKDDQDQLDWLRQFMPKVLQEIRSRGWKQPVPLAFIEVIPRPLKNPNTSSTQDTLANENKSSAYYNQGNELAAAQRYEEAVQAYEQAIQFNPDEDAYHYSKGLTLYNLNRYEDALVAYNQALFFAPTKAHIYNAKGITLGTLKRYEEALEAHLQAVQLAPDEGTYHYNVGLVLYELKRYQEALASYGSALQYIPNYALAHAGQGRAYFSLGEYQKAIECFDLAFTNDGTLTWAKTQREEAFRLLGTTTTSSMLQIEVLGERYQLQEPIAHSGMATIYRGHDIRMDHTVAIKVLREIYSSDPKFVTRFQREAKAASSLQHPNIVQVYDYGQSEGNYFIVMELVEGTNLRRYLHSRGALAINRAVIIAHDIALGLGTAHRRQIVHRDVKPQNILLGRDGSIKLTDFGIASVYKDINAERLTTPGMTLGTVQYYAPEQAQGEIVNPAADVYALGIVMYEMLTGRTPFEGDTPVAVAMQHIQDPPLAPSQLNPNIPPVLEEVILRCLEKAPEMRYRNGTLLARALELLGEEEISNTPSFMPIEDSIGPSNPSTIPLQQAVHAMSQARLTILLPQAQQQIYHIEKRVINIGRQLSNDIIVEDKRVSRYHAQIKYQPDGQFVIFDLGSTNGITINNTPHVRQHVLRNGDRFTIGSYDFYFEIK